jgi:hypothetical protein
MKRLLDRLDPVADFHLMGLHPDMFGCFAFLPAAAFLPIARIRIDRLSRMAAERGWGGIAGHYLPITRGWLNRHHGLGQGIGTGFVDSPRCLFREVGRGVDWIFSNRAAQMQGVCVPGSEFRGLTAVAAWALKQRRLCLAPSPHRRNRAGRLRRQKGSAPRPCSSGRPGCPPQRGPRPSGRAA